MIAVRSNGGLVVRETISAGADNLALGLAVFHQSYSHMPRCRGSCIVGEISKLQRISTIERSPVIGGISGSGERVLLKAHYNSLSRRNRILFLGTAFNKMVLEIIISADLVIVLLPPLIIIR